MPRGGTRPGAGRPKGKQEPATLERARVLNALRHRICQKADRLLNAQFTLAEGCSYLIRIEDTKGKDAKRKHVIVTDPGEILRYLDGDVDPAQYHYITTDKPNNEALRDLWDRTFGKPIQGMEISGPNGGDIPTRVRFVDA